MGTINPNSAFVRVMFDLPTPIAIKFDEVVKASGKSKKRYLQDIITDHIDSTTTKGKKK